MSDEAKALRPDKLVHIVQGTYAVAADNQTVMTALLGSCVAACLFDTRAGVGGMNHFLLPQAKQGPSDQVLYGAQAMELLINAMLKKGARKERFKAKLFGGGRMIAGLSDIGRGNGEFALRFLRDEGIPCIAESLGGTKARRIRFWPLSGKAHRILLGSAQDVEAHVPRLPNTDGDLELF